MSITMKSDLEDLSRREFLKAASVAAVGLAVDGRRIFAGEQEPFFEDVGYNCFIKVESRRLDKTYGPGNYFYWGSAIFVYFYLTYITPETATERKNRILWL